MDTRTGLALAALLTVAVGASIVMNRIHKSNFTDDKLLERGMNTPTVWIYMDDSDVNTRWWADFGARSSRVYNMPFLNLCYQTIIKSMGSKYHVEVISGLADAERRLGSLPFPMQNKKLPLRDEEMTYLKVAFLEKYGGIWMTPATVCIREFPELPKDKVVLFGSDPLETYAGPQGTFFPNQHVLWSPRPNHPFFSQWKGILGERIERQPGGKQIRTDKNWDSLLVGSGKEDVVVMTTAELGRKKGGRKLELEDLLAAGTSGDLPFAIPPEAIYVPFPWPELLQRRMYGWFLRMSEEQIMQSDLAITYLFRLGGVV